MLIDTGQLTQLLVCYDNTIDARGLGSIQVGHSVATAVAFLQSCVSQALSRGGGIRHSLPGLEISI